ncbi:MAG TPA: TonB-dependent receptor, partial [Polyangiaceae bacterium]|nr:TonB-dependent receptor [Polyangiaceae bacterium]
HTVTLATLFELEKLSANLRYRVVSSAFIDVQDGPPRSPSFGLLDARVAYRLFPALNLFVGALNLTDTRRDYLNPSDTRPVLGRQFYLGLTGEAPE